MRGVTRVTQCLFLNRCNGITNMVLQIENGPLAKVCLFQKLINLVTDVIILQTSIALKK